MLQLTVSVFKVPVREPSRKGGSLECANDIAVLGQIAEGQVL